MDDRTFRTAMGKFATGVTVVTTKVNDTVHGMTANSFVSVSLNPKLVLISVGKQTSMHNYIKQSGSFAISVLNEKQEEISALFASQLKDEREIEFELFNEMEVISDAIVQITCELYDMTEAGDHTLYIGEVTDLRIQDGEPLCFYGGKYRKVT